MSAGYLELFIEQGEDFNIDITLDSINGNTYSIVGSNVKSEIRKSHWSANSVASFNATVKDGPLGIINLSLTANTTQNLPYGRYVYDVFLTNSGHTRSKIIGGIIYIDPSSTKI